MDFDVTHRTIFAGLEILHNATLTDCGESKYSVQQSSLWISSAYSNCEVVCFKSFESVIRREMKYTTLTRMETFCDGGCVDKVSCAEVANDVFI